MKDLKLFGTLGILAFLIVLSIFAGESVSSYKNSRAITYLAKSDSTNFYDLDIVIKTTTGDHPFKYVMYNPSLGEVRLNDSIKISLVLPIANKSLEDSEWKIVSSRDTTVRIIKDYKAKVFKIRPHFHLDQLALD